MDFKNDAKKQMIDAWNGVYKSSLKTLTYSRNEESYSTNPDNDTSGTVPYYDPVNETWVYPVGAPDNQSYSIKCLIRDVKKDAGKDPTLAMTDIKLTVIADDFISVVGSEPEVSDTVEYNSKSYRVVKWDTDTVDCFYHLFIRGV